MSLLWSNWLDWLVWKVVAAPIRAFLSSSFLLLIALLITTVPTLHAVRGCPGPLPNFFQGILSPGEAAGRRAALDLLTAWITAPEDLGDL